MAINRRPERAIPQLLQRIKELEARVAALEEALSAPKAAKASPGKTAKKEK